MQGEAIRSSIDGSHEVRNTVTECFFDASIRFQAVWLKMIVIFRSTIVARASFFPSKSLRDISCHLAVANVSETVEVTPGLRKHLRDTIGQCYKMCFEYHKDAMKFVSLNGSCKSPVSHPMAMIHGVSKRIKSYWHC